MEFSFISNGLLNLTKDNLIQAKTSSETNQFQIAKAIVYNQFMHFLYKPDATVNQLAPVYLNYQDLISIAPSALVDTYKLNNETANPQNFSLRNPMGSILNAVANPNYYSYAERLLNTNAKIQVFKQIYIEKLDLTEITQQAFSYYNQVDHWKFSADKTQICLNSPINQKTDANCLMLSAK